MIEFRNIHVKFRNRYLFRNLNFRINKGEKVLFYGPSGIGKTTLFRLILGFESPYSGTIFFEGRAFDDKTAWTIRKRISYVPQNPDFGKGTVQAILKRILSFRANAKLSVSKDQILKLIKFFRLDQDILSSNFEKLSGGEKQRIALVIAVLLKRHIYLLDETTAWLDLELKNKIMNFFTREKDRTVIIISHDRNWIEVPGIKVIQLGANDADA